MAASTRRGEHAAQQPSLQRILRFMRQLRLGALLALSVLASAAVALAEPSNTGALGTPRASVVLVLESSEGTVGANQLRAALSRQFGLKVLALGDAQHGADQPRALMAIAMERGRTVRVVYVDALGRRDTLRAGTARAHGYARAQRVGRAVEAQLVGALTLALCGALSVWISKAPQRRSPPRRFLNLAHLPSRRHQVKEGIAFHNRARPRQRTETTLGQLPVQQEVHQRGHHLTRGALHEVALGYALCHVGEWAGVAVDDQERNAT
jgi:hypothetical protein